MFGLIRLFSEAGETAGGAAETADEVYGVGTMALYSVIGFVLVIAVLILLIVLLVVFSKILNAIPSGKTKQEKRQPAAVQPSAPAASDDVEAETVAAITAAIAAYYDGAPAAAQSADEDDIPVPFVIRSIRKL